MMLPPGSALSSLSFAARRCVCAISTALLFAVSLLAQPADASQDEAVVVLSPFTVHTSKDIGYEASSSLSGTGLNTKLIDLGASVSVVTAKFLEDTGSTKLSEVLVYQTNMDVKGFGGGFSGVTPAQGGVLTRTPAPTAAVAQQAAYNPFYPAIDLRREDERVSNPDGTIPVWSIAEGRKVTLTTRISF